MDSRRTDPLADLDHDHRSLREGLERLAKLVRHEGAGASDEVRATTLIETAHVLRDEFVEHFGDEEEWIFPLLAELRPESRETLLELSRAHDALCGLAVRIASVAERDGGSGDTLTTLLDRLEREYRDHAQREVEFLRAIAGSLSEAERATVRARKK